MLKYEKPEEDLYMIIPFLGSLGLRQKVRYLIAIPTTCSGAETTYAAVATDMLRDPPKKLELYNDELMPDIAILDVDFVKDTCQSNIRFFSCNSYKRNFKIFTKSI